MRSPNTQKGYSLLELMITVAVLGILAAMVSRMYMTGLKAWFNGYASVAVQSNLRVSREIVSKELRRASQASILVSKYDNNQPSSSLVEFVDVDGNTLAFYQSGNDLMQYITVSGTATAYTKKLIQGDLERFYVYYPNAKDLNHIGFGLFATRQPEPSSPKLVAVCLQSVEELRNP